jgi:transcriptional regulator with XRE-family HTH domain
MRQSGREMAKDKDLPGIGERLRQAREAAGVSQGQVAKLMGLHRPAITDVENEARKVSAGELARFAELYHVSPEWIMGEKPTAQEKVKLAARKLQGLKEADLETVMRIIDSFRKSGAGR